VVVTAILSVVLSAAAPSLSDGELLDRAEAAFAEGLQLRVYPSKAKPQFRKAAELYQQLHQRGIRNPALYRNEGNAWLLAEEWPHALLAYRRGLRLDPADSGLREGLTVVREKVNHVSASGFGRPPTDNRPPWLPRLGLSGWSFALLLLWYGLGCLLLTRWLMTRRAAALLFGAVSLGLGGATALLLTVTTQHERAENQYPLAIIATDKVVLRKGNGEAYPPRHDTPLHRGVEARRLFWCQRSDWVQIQLSSGEVGWVSAKNVLVDEPTPEPQSSAGWVAKPSAVDAVSPIAMP
jgi:tetratricopeptide (TPR) repeat protein